MDQEKLAAAQNLDGSVSYHFATVIDKGNYFANDVGLLCVSSISDPVDNFNFQVVLSKVYWTQVNNAQFLVLSRHLDITKT